MSIKYLAPTLSNNIRMMFRKIPSGFNKHIKLGQNMNESKRGSGLAIIHFFNNKKALMKNVSLQDLTPNPVYLLNYFGK